jgi:hypothetical protein
MAKKYYEKHFFPLTRFEYKDNLYENGRLRAEVDLKGLEYSISTQRLFLLMKIGLL